MLRFLSTAFYEQNEQGEKELMGAMVTSFDPGSLTGKARLDFMSPQQLIECCNNKEACGFSLDETGCLKSDTPSTIYVDGDTQEYLNKDKTLERSSGGLIDVLRAIAAVDARVIPNWDDVVVHNDEPIHVPVVSFKVSNSSFNIYAPYLAHDNNFRTCSLIDIECNKAKQFAVAIPDGVGLTNWLAECMTPTGISDDEYHYYLVTAELEVAEGFYGEAFCNYLAYYVSYYKMGLDVIDWFRKTYGLGIISAEDERPDSPRSTVSREAKIPAGSMTIESFYKKHDAAFAIKLMQSGDTEQLKHRMTHDPEFFISCQWINAILTEASKYEGADTEKFRSACLCLRARAKSMLFHVSIELLTQRLYIYDLGMFADPLNATLKGGGVHGCSCKRYYN